MKMRRILIFLAFGLTLWLAFASEPPSDNKIVETAERSKDAHKKPERKTNSENEKSTFLIELFDRRSLIEVDEKTKTTNLFDPQSWVPPPVVSGTVKPVVAATPTAPVLPFQYIGKKLEDGQYEVFLANGDKTYAVLVNTVIENTYRVDAIKPPLMHLTYLPLNQAQTISIGPSD